MINQAKEKIIQMPLWPLTILFFTSTDTVMFGTNLNKMLLYVPRVIGVCFVLLGLFVFKDKIKFQIKMVASLILFFIIAVFSAIYNDMDFATIASRLISVIVAFFIATFYSKKQYINVFNKVVYFIAIVAIITEIIAYVAPSLFDLFPTVVNTANYSFSYFFIGSMRHSFLGEIFIRAGGIFWEPGAFATYIVIALMFELFFVEKTKTKRLVVYALTLLLTFSTTGYIAFAFLMIVFIFSTNFNKTKNKAFLGALFVGLLLILLFENNPIYEMVFAKIKNNNNTSVVRYSSLINGMEIAFDHPLLGIGSNNIREYMIEYSTKSIFNFGSNPMLTNTLVRQFATFGLIFGALFLFGTLKFFLNEKSKFRLPVRLGLFIALMLLYTGEAFYSFLPFVFVFYGLKGESKDITE
jgi:hypothetical protein